MNCYRCRVTCTNSSNDTFAIRRAGEPDKYAGAKYGFAYVCAETFSGAVKAVGDALESIECIGPAMIAEEKA